MIRLNSPAYVFGIVEEKILLTEMEGRAQLHMADGQFVTATISSPYGCREFYVVEAGDHWELGQEIKG